MRARVGMDSLFADLPLPPAPQRGASACFRPPRYTPRNPAMQTAQQFASQLAAARDPAERQRLHDLMVLAMLAKDGCKRA